MNTSPRELLHERSLANRVALLKLVLSLASLFAIAIDRAAPLQTERGVTIAFGTATGFLLYNAIGFFALRRGFMSVPIYQRLIPLSDVAAVSLLILATNGYLSQFNLWFAITVVASGFSSSAILPLIVALASIGAQFAIATVPQAEPLDPAVFAVRTGFLIAFAFLVASISNLLVRQAVGLYALEHLSDDLASVRDTKEAVELFKGYVKTHFSASYVKVSLEPGVMDPRAIPIRSGHYVLGNFIIGRDRPLTLPERQLAGLFADRLCTAITRSELGSQLVKATAREERRKFADQLHDTHLQTLAAVDMQAELASRKTSSEEIAEEMQIIKETVRSAAKRTREYIDSLEEQEHSGPDALEQVVRTRWPGATFIVEREAKLNEGQWRAVLYLVQEGLNNAKRHGNAKQVTVMVHRFGDVVEAVVQADGRSPDLTSRYGYGLRRLDTVVSANGGELRLTPGALGGSRLSALFNTE